MLSDSDYLKVSVQYIVQEKIVERSVFTTRPEWYEKVLLALKDNIQCFRDLEDRLKLFSDEFAFEDPDMLKTENAQLILSELAKLLKSLEQLDESNFDKVFKDLKKKVKIKGKDIFMPLRVALTGREHGPELKRVVVLLGKNNCLKRVERALSFGATEGKGKK